MALISKVAAERYWPNESAVGKTLLRNPDGSDAITVIGVADNVKIWSLSEAPMPYVYAPFHQGYGFGTFFVTAQGTARPADLAALIRNESRAIDPEIFLTEVGKR